LTPSSARQRLHRQYEALRAFYVDKVPGTEVAAASTTPRAAFACCASVPPGSGLPFFLPNRHALRAAAAGGQKDPRTP